MNKICIVAKNKETYFIKRLIEEVGCEVRVFDPWSDFELPAAAQYLVRTTGVYGSDLDLLILNSLAPQVVVNPTKSLELFRTKNQQYSWFEAENFPALPWISLKGQDSLIVEKFFRLYPELVVKPLVGQGGWGVELLTWDSFKRWKKKHLQDQDYLLQPFIRGGEEFRYFFIKGEKPLVLKREHKTEVTANFKNRGEASISSIPSQFHTMLETLIEKSGLFYGAIDLIIKDEELSILEVNAVPGIEQLEKVSGHNITQLLLNALTRYKP